MPEFCDGRGRGAAEKETNTEDFVRRAASLTSPALPAIDTTYDLLVTGVGGTGVVTVGALIAMAAHLQGMGSSVLDFTGFAQKFGPVLSFIRLAETPGAINQVRTDNASTDALIGCDIVVSSSPKASGTYRPGMKAVVNLAEMPTGDIVRFRDADLASRRRLKEIARVIGEGNVQAFDANGMAEKLFGDAVYANMHHAGLRLAARAGAGIAGCAGACDRVERRDCRSQQAGLCRGQVWLSPMPNSARCASRSRQPRRWMR